MRKDDLRKSRKQASGAMQNWAGGDEQNSFFPKEGFASTQAMTHVPPSLRGGRQCQTSTEVPLTDPSFTGFPYSRRGTASNRAKRPCAD